MSEINLNHHNRIVLTNLRKSSAPEFQVWTRNPSKILGKEISGLVLTDALLVFFSPPSKHWRVGFFTPIYPGYNPKEYPMYK